MQLKRTTEYTVHLEKQVQNQPHILGELNRQYFSTLNQLQESQKNHQESDKHLAQARKQLAWFQAKLQQLSKFESFEYPEDNPTKLQFGYLSMDNIIVVQNNGQFSAETIQWLKDQMFAEILDNFEITRFNKVLKSLIGKKWEVHQFYEKEATPRKVEERLPKSIKFSFPYKSKIRILYLAQV